MQSNELISEICWLGLLSFTGKAALSMAFDDKQDCKSGQEWFPHTLKVKLMALVLITYAFFVDSTLFNISFGIPLTILVILSVISVISL